MVGNEMGFGERGRDGCICSVNPDPGLAIRLPSVRGVRGHDGGPYHEAHHQPASGNRTSARFLWIGRRDFDAHHRGSTQSPREAEPGPDRSNTHRSSRLDDQPKQHALGSVSWPELAHGQGPSAQFVCLHKIPVVCALIGQAKAHFGRDNLFDWPTKFKDILDTSQQVSFLTRYVMGFCSRPCCTERPTLFGAAELKEKGRFYGK